jgi:hypothetical protein
MVEKSSEDQLKLEMERKHYARAALLAAEMNHAAEEVRDLRLKALWQISAVSRNAPGAIILGRDYGLTRDQVAECLRAKAKEEKEQGAYKALEPCYDQITGKYLSFDDWLEHLLKHWDKTGVS